jgi:hypothetical protein
MARGKRSTGARSLGSLWAAVVIVGASALLLAAAWASWRWQHASSTKCGREPATGSTPVAANAHAEWERCRTRTQADGAVPAALAVFAVMVTAGGVAMAFVVRSGTRWIGGEVR